jgi:hypothetical protein
MPKKKKEKTSHNCQKIYLKQKLKDKKNSLANIQPISNGASSF